MSRTFIALLLGAATTLAATTASAETATIEAFDNATIQPGGPRGGSSGINFFNIEGSGNGNFASYGVARFDLSGAKAGFDAQFGAGGWAVDSVALLLTQSNAGFTTDGGVVVYHSNVDSPAPLSASGYVYANLASDFADRAELLRYSFTEVATGTQETHTLWNGAPSAAGQQLLADIGSDKTLTLVLAEADAGVAATYAGYNNNTWAGPTLQLTVSAVPEPASLVLMLGGLAAVGALGAARRRA